MKAIVALVAAIVIASSLTAQQPVAERLRGAAPQVVSAVEQTVADAVARGLPTEPLIQKAIEGTAKGAGPERVASAIRALLDRMTVAAAALRDGGATANAPAIEAASFALSAGLNQSEVSRVTRQGAPALALEVALQVSGTLAASGVPAAQVVELVGQALEAGESSEGLLALPAKVQAAIARGATPAAAAAGLARAAEARGRRHDPSRRGPPPERGKPARP